MYIITMAPPLPKLVKVTQTVSFVEQAPSPIDVDDFCANFTYLIPSKNPIEDIRNGM